MRFRMVQDDWQGPAVREKDTERPTEEQVRQAIKKLDNTRYTIVGLHADGEAYILIGGGGGKYVVTGTLDGSDFFSLCSMAKEEVQIRLFIGGQDGEYPSSTVVDFDSACAAALYFLREGRLAPELTWHFR